MKERKSERERESEPENLRTMQMRFVEEVRNGLRF